MVTKAKSLRESESWSTDEEKLDFRNQAGDFDWFYNDIDKTYNMSVDDKNMGLKLYFEIKTDKENRVMMGIRLFDQKAEVKEMKGAGRGKSEDERIDEMMSVAHNTALKFDEGVFGKGVGSFGKIADYVNTVIEGKAIKENKAWNEYEGIGREEKCIGYRNIKEGDFKSEYADKFKEDKRRRILEETYGVPVEKIVCFDEKGREMYFLERKDKRSAGSEVWMFKNDLMDHQYGMFLKEFDALEKEYLRTGNRKYYYDSECYYEEWGKSRLNGNEQFLMSVIEKDKECKLMIALEDNFEKTNLYYQVDKKYGNKKLKDFEKEAFKHYISNNIDEWVKRKNIYKDFDIFEDFINKAIQEVKLREKNELTKDMINNEKKCEDGPKERLAKKYGIDEKIAGEFYEIACESDGEDDFKKKANEFADDFLVSVKTGKRTFEFSENFNYASFRKDALDIWYDDDFETKKKEGKGEENEKRKIIEGLKCYGYEKCGKEYGISRGKLKDINEFGTSLFKVVYETEKGEIAYELHRLGKPGTDKFEKWLFKDDFKNDQAVEFLKQFDRDRENKKIKDTEKTKDKSKGAEYDR
jgi:hypothetical protein